jgi:hypothetical protein
MKQSRCCPASRRAADNSGFVDGEMSIPLLSSGMKKADNVAGQWV